MARWVTLSHDPARLAIYRMAGLLPHPIVAGRETHADSPSLWFDLFQRMGVHKIKGELIYNKNTNASPINRTSTDQSICHPNASGDIHLFYSY